MARVGERTQRRMQRLAERTRAEERARDLALARLVAVLEHAHADEIPHLTGRFRTGDGIAGWLAFARPTRPTRWRLWTAWSV